MKIVRNASAGTLESSDVYVEVSPSDGGATIEVESVVINQFGDKIRSLVDDIVRENGVSDVTVRLCDKGALECVIRARVETALLRAGEGEQ